LPELNIRKNLTKRIAENPPLTIKELTEEPLNLLLQFAVELQDEVSCRPDDEFLFPQGIIRRDNCNAELLEGFWYHSWLSRPNRAKIRLVSTGNLLSSKYLQEILDEIISLWIDLLEGKYRHPAGKTIPFFTKF